MYWLRLYEYEEINSGFFGFGHKIAYGKYQNFVGPEFLNSINRYYGYQVWI